MRVIVVMIRVIKVTLIFLTISFFIGNNTSFAAATSDSTGLDSVNVYKNSFGLEFNTIYHALDHKINTQNIFPLPFELYYKRKLSDKRNFSFRAGFYFKQSLEDTLKYAMREFDFPDTLPQHDYEMNVLTSLKRGYESEYRISAGLELNPISYFKELKIGFLCFYEKDNYIYYGDFSRVYIDTTTYSYGLATGQGFYSNNTNMMIIKYGLSVFLNVEIPFNSRFGIHFLGNLSLQKMIYKTSSFSNYDPNTIYNNNYNYRIVAEHISTGLHFNW